MKQRTLKHLIRSVFWAILLIPIWTTAQTDTIIEGGNVSGTWNPEHNYIVTDDIFVESNDSLTILAGTSVLFYEEKGLQVFGVLIAEGVQSDQIVFTAENPEKPWAGIDFSQAKRESGKANGSRDQESVISHCLIEYVSELADAALNINGAIAPIEGCIFRGVETIPISIQPSCPNVTLNISQNVFDSIVSDYCIALYQNTSLEQLNISGNNFNQIGKGVQIEYTLLNSCLFENNDVTGVDLIGGASKNSPFMVLSNNDLLLDLHITDNSFAHITGASSQDPHIFDLASNEALDDIELNNNLFDHTGRIITVDNCNSFHSEMNVIRNSESFALGYMMYINSDFAEIISDSIFFVSIDQFGYTHTGIYTFSPNNQGIVNATDCYFENNSGNCYVLNDFNSADQILIQGNTILDCTSERDGVVLWIDGTANTGSTVSNVQIENNDIDNVFTSRAGSVKLEILGKLESFASQNNKYNSRSNLTGGSVYIEAPILGSISFESDTIIKSLVGEQRNDQVAGGFAYIKTDSVSETITVNNIFCEEAFALGYGGLFFINIQGNAENLSITNSNIQKASVDGGFGGLLYLTTSGYLNEFVFTGNDYPGSDTNYSTAGTVFYLDIHNDLVHAEVNDNQISHVSADSIGGLFVMKINNKLKHCEFKYNTFTKPQEPELSTPGQGGALFLDASEISHLDMQENHFSGWKSSEQGGALYLNAANEFGKLMINGSLFSRCMADEGGAVFANSGLALGTFVSDSNTFDQCQAIENGGGIHLTAPVADTIFILGSNNSEFFDCSVLNGSGGGCYLNIQGNAGYLEFENLDFINDTGSMSPAEHGAAIYLQVNGVISEGLHLTGNQFHGMHSSSSGGAVFLDLNNNPVNGHTLVSNNFFEDCSANNNNAYGGAIAFESGGFNSLDINDNSFINCTSAESGGGLAIKMTGDVQESFAFSSNHFENMTSNSFGGAVLFDFEECSFQNGMHFQNNSFTNCVTNEEISNGGAIALIGDEVAGNLEIVDCNFTNCISSVNGGGIYLSLLRLDTLICRNEIDTLGFRYCSVAEGSGGAVYMEVDQSAVDKILFQNIHFQGDSSMHEAGEKGGAIYLNCNEGIEHGLFVTDNVFQHLSSPDGGSVLSLHVLEENEVNHFEFKNNNLQSCYVDHGDGGTLDINSGFLKRAYFINSEFVDCRTLNGNGGAIALKLSFEKLSFLQNRFLSCQAGNGDNFGGNVYIDGSGEVSDSIVLTGNRFIGKDFLSVKGGALYVQDVSSVFSSANYYVDHAVSQDGGAVYMQNVDLVQFEDDTLLLNHAMGSGGAVMLEGANQNIFIAENLHLRGNHSELAGGAIAIQYFKQANLADCELFQNKVGSDAGGSYFGGALYMYELENLQIAGSKFIDNVLIDNQQEELTYGGALYSEKAKSILLSENSFYLNQALFGGGIFISDDSLTKMQNNSLIANSAQNGGAAYFSGSLAQTDSAIISDNNFFNNTMAFQGGGLFIERDSAFLFRNKFIRNQGIPADDDLNIKGSSVYLSPDVSNVNIFNNIFDRNRDDDFSNYNNATLYLDGGFNQENETARLYIENSDFLNNWPAKAHVVYNQHLDDSVKIRNSIFQGNGGANDSLFNSQSILTYYSRLEGELFGVPHIHPYFDLYVSPQDSYILIDDSPLIDSGDMTETFNDRFLPPGKGTERCDLGASGGRYNMQPLTYLEKVESYLYDAYLEMERLSCNDYRVEFGNELPSGFDHFVWYLDDTIYETTDNYLEFQFNNEKDVTLLGIAYNDQTEEFVSAREWLFDMKIEHKGMEIVFSNKRQAAQTIKDTAITLIYPDQCLQGLTMKAYIKELSLQTNENYNYNWSVNSGDLVELAEVESINKDSVNVFVDLKREAAFNNAWIDVIYYGYYEIGGDVCEETVHDTLRVYFDAVNFEYLNVQSFDPSNGATLIYNEFKKVDISLNQIAGYNDSGNYEEIPLQTNINDLNLFSLYEDGFKTGIDSVLAEIASGRTKFTIYPDTSFIEADKIYRLEASNLIITKCFWQFDDFDYEINTIPTDITELKKGQLKVIPNPVYDVASVIFDTPFDGQITLFNMDGSVLSSSYVTNEREYRLDMGGLSPGLYVIQLLREEGLWRFKIMKE